MLKNNKIINFLIKKNIYLLLILIFIVNILICYQKYIAISFHFHDFFQFNNGYAFEELKLHKEFHSNLGLFHHLLRYSSLQIVKLFQMNIVGAALIANLIIISIILLLWFFIKKDNSIKHASNAVLILIVLTILNSIFNINDWLTHVQLAGIITGGFYNIHSYGFLLLQVYYVLAYHANKNCNHLQGKSENINRKALINAIFLYIAFNFKINFFPATCIISLAFFFIVNNKKKFLLYNILYFLSLTLFFALVFQYNYILYFKDLIIGLHARDDFLHPPAVKKIIFLTFFPLITTAVMSAVYIVLKIKNIKNINIVESVMIYLFAFLVLLISSAMNSSPEQMIFYYSFFIILIIISIKNKIFVPLVHIVIIAFLTLTLMKYHFMFLNKKLQYNQYFFKNKKDNTYLGFKIFKNEITGFGLEILNKNFNEDTLLKLSYNIEPTFRKTIFTSEYLYPAPLILAETLKDIYGVLTENNIKNDTKVFNIALASPTRMFGYSLPKETFEWLHIGYTVNIKDLNGAIIKSAKNSDIVILDIFGLDNHTFEKADNTLMNCFFYEFNDKFNQFELWKITKYGVYFIDKKYAQDNNIQLFNKKNYILSKKDIVKTCQKLIDTHIKERKFKF